MGNVDLSYESCKVIKEVDFPEDESKLIERCKETLSGILNNASGDNLAIVSHAPCVQALAFILEGVNTTKESKLSQWPLGGITRFSRDVDFVEDNKMSCKVKSYGKWKMDFYGITDHMPGDYKYGAGLWSLPCFSKSKSTDSM